jgi:hypothetical protein
MQAAKVGTRTSYGNENAFFQTTPVAIDADVEAFCLQLGGLKAGFVPVIPAPGAETGFCQRNVAEHVERHGGRPSFGWALWVNKICLMGEFHAVWVSPTGEMVDVTPAAEGETSIAFAPDAEYPVDFDFNDRPMNRTMRTTGKTDLAAVVQATDALSPARRAYEEKRAARKGMDLVFYLAAKTGRSELTIAVDDLLRCCAERDRLVVPTASGVYSPNPKAFLAVQSRVMELERRVEQLLAKRNRLDRPAVRSGDDRSVAAGGASQNDATAKMRARHTTAGRLGTP